MTLSAATTTNNAQLLKEYLHTHGKRCTPERFMILEAAMEMTGHFTAESLGQILGDSGRRVATATVYSTLQILVECGIIRRLRTDMGGASLYETAPSNHMHLICTCCGKIKDVRDDILDRHLRERRYTGFSPSGYTLNISGICSSCTRKKHRRK